MAVMDYINELKNQRDLLADILSEKGVTASRSEKFNTLIPKVNYIGGGCGVDTLGIMSGEVNTIDVGAVYKISTPILDGIIPNMSAVCELEVQ